MLPALLAIALLAPPPFFSKQRFVDDAKALLPSPGEAPHLALFVLGVGALSRMDRDPSARFADRAPSQLHRFEPLGRYQVGNALGFGFLGWGLFARDSRAASAGVAFVEANLVSSLAVAGLQKLTGRVRPGNPHAGDFGRGGTSFPSAHAAHAFAAAGVAYASFPEFRGRWVFPALAAGVALSRVADRKHFFADVVASAGLGWWLGTRLGSSGAQHTGWRWGVAPRGVVVSLSLP